MKAIRKQLDVLMGGNQNGDIKEVNHRYEDHVPCFPLQSTARLYLLPETCFLSCQLLSLTIMAISVAAKSELSHSFGASTTPSFKPILSRPHPPNFAFNHLSHRFPLLSVVVKSSVFSMLSKHEGALGADAVRGLTCKDLGVILIPVLSLLGELQRCHLELEDLGGLFLWVMYWHHIFSRQKNSGERP